MAHAAGWPLGGAEALDEGLGVHEETAPAVDDRPAGREGAEGRGTDPPTIAGPSGGSRRTNTKSGGPAAS